MTRGRYVVFGTFATEKTSVKRNHFFGGIIEEEEVDRKITGRTVDKFGHASIRGEIRGEHIILTKTYDQRNQRFDYELTRLEKNTYSGRWIGERTKGNVTCLVLPAPYNIQSTEILNFLGEGTNKERMFTEP